MSSTTRVTGTAGPSPASGSSVKILVWPAQQAACNDLEGLPVPRLVLVEEGNAPPVSADCCQDWMWKSGGEGEVRLRLHQLALRALTHGHSEPELDALGMLHVGLRSVHLPAKERAIIVALLQSFGRPVLRDELVRVAWPQGLTTRTILPSRISRLRARLRWLGLEICGSSGTGYCLRAHSFASDTSATEGFEDELTSTGRPGG